MAQLTVVSIETLICHLHFVIDLGVVLVAICFLVLLLDYLPLGHDGVPLYLGNNLAGSDAQGAAADLELRKVTQVA